MNAPTCSALALVGAFVCAPAAAQDDGDNPTAEPKAEAPSDKPAEKPKAKPEPAADKKTDASENKPAEPPAPKKPAPPPPKPAKKPPPKPAPAKKPAPVKKPPPRKPAPPPPEEEAKPMDARTKKLLQDLDRALAKKKPDARQLETLCAGWQPRRVFEDAPILTARLPLCAARAALLSDRLDVATQRTDQALAALRKLPADDETEMLRAEATLLRARLAEEELDQFESCGTRLGLARLTAFEASWSSALMADVVGRYEEVVRTGSRQHARRALFAVGRLYERFYRQYAGSLPDSYRGARLPAPFLVERVDGTALLAARLDPKAAAWPREIARLYEKVIAETERAGDDPEFLARVEKQAAGFQAIAGLPKEKATNPWADVLRAGVIRHGPHGFERRTEGGEWEKVSDEDLQQQLLARVEQNVEDVEGAWALVALASSGYPVPSELVTRAIESKSRRVQLAGLLAAERAPRADLYDPLADYLAAQRLGGNDSLFKSLQSALFGLKERGLLALRKVVDRERDLAAKLIRDDRIPVAERAWMLADLGDNRLGPYYQQLSTDRDPRAAAMGIYGHYLAVGSRMMWSARPRDDGIVGCVSRNVQTYDRAVSRPNDLDMLTNP